jgi:hypothetical protein
MAQDLHEVGVRVEELLAELRAAPDPALFERAEQLVSLLVEFYGAGLERLLALVAREPSGDLLVRRLAQDDLLSGLFALHGLHPVPVEDRVGDALKGLRRELGATRVTLQGIDEAGVARCELAVGGCGSAPLDVARKAVERAVLDAAPGVFAVDFGATAAGPAPAPVEPGPVPVQIGRTRTRPDTGPRPESRVRIPVEVERRFFAKPDTRPAGEICELCNEAIPAEHPHVVNLESRALQCSCRPCYMLFTERGAGGGRYASVPERYLHDRDFSLTDAQWDEFQIPVRMAFFFVNSVLGKTVAFYPSPAGATESMLPDDTWGEIMAANPLFATIEPDVEALLVYRRDRAYECFLVPIDACYELVGHVRKNWKGFDGGEEAWAAIDGFFDGLRSRSRTAVPSGEAAARSTA